MFIHNKIHGLFEYIGIVSTIFDVVAPFDLSNKSNIANQTFLLLKEDIKYPPTISITFHIYLFVPFVILCQTILFNFHVLHVFQKNTVYILKYVFKAKFEPNTCLLKRKVPTNNINFDT